MPCLHELLKEVSLLHHKEIDLGLERCLALLEKLGNPHLYIPPAFHVAGTNGKGSTLAFIKQILEDNGYSVHRYTSPHLVRFNERIELCGMSVSDEVLVDTFTEILRINNGEPLTTFELITCLAFLLFAQTPADFTLLEVGMGGRLDATNVIQKPLITGITSISLDHQADLGRTVEVIAFEKAGIIKPNIPVVVSQNLKASVYEVIAQVAQKQKAPLIIASTTMETDLGLIGEHQRANAGLALKMIESVGIKCCNIRKSLHKTTWSGRLQKLVLSCGELWIDGAHNEEGAKALALSLAKLDPRPWTFFIHIKARKDAACMLKHLASVADSFYFVDFSLEGGESIPTYELLQLSSQLGIRSFLVSNIDDMCDVIKKADTPVIAAGSLFLAGFILHSIADFS